VISHLHADHCHLPSLRRLAPGTKLVGPTGIARFLRGSMGAAAPDCQEVVPGEEVAMGGLVLRALYAEHDDRRSPVSRHRAQPLSFLVSPGLSARSSLWFGGDTALHDGLAEPAPVRLALVPVGGWGPGLGPGHLDGETAADAVARLSAATAIPIHFGTFWPRGLDRVAPEQFLGPERRFADRAREVAPDTEVCVLSPGESLEVGG
jgi:L-ascorbate metabolism protein UlaG (beta-lactamase superfamily)